MKCWLIGRSVVTLAPPLCKDPMDVTLIFSHVTYLYSFIVLHVCRCGKDDLGTGTQETERFLKIDWLFTLKKGGVSPISETLSFFVIISRFSPASPIPSVVFIAPSFKAIFHPFHASQLTADYSIPPLELDSPSSTLPLKKRENRSTEGRVNKPLLRPSLSSETTIISHISSRTLIRKHFDECWSQSEDHANHLTGLSHFI